MVELAQSIRLVSCSDQPSSVPMFPETVSITVSIHTPLTEESRSTLPPMLRDGDEVTGTQQFN